MYLSVSEFNKHSECDGSGKGYRADVGSFRGPEGSERQRRATMKRGQRRRQSTSAGVQERHIQDPNASIPRLRTAPATRLFTLAGTRCGHAFNGGTASVPR